MTLLEALARVRKDLMQVETKGESSAYIVEALGLLAQIENSLTPASKTNVEESEDTEEVEAENIAAEEKNENF